MTLTKAQWSVLKELRDSAYLTRLEALEMAYLGGYANAVKDCVKKLKEKES